ncbi:hypothetical protein F5X99DRAFT_46645 [Biscogniauxia marginata]|nr:hypothetical protein F5X99DRAFT_46645 [Biscogniauxia marginata]
MSSYPESIELPMGTLTAIKTTFVSITALVVAVRLYTNFTFTTKLLVEDYLALAALVSLAATSVLTDIAGNGFHDPTTSPLVIAQLAVAIVVLAGFSLWSSKAPVLFLYIRLFGIQRWIRLSSYGILTLTAICFVVGVSIATPHCTPHSDAITPEVIQQCQTTVRAANVVMGTVAVIADTIILFLPLPVLFKLRLLLHKKIGLILIFMTGVLASVASAVSLAFKWRSLEYTSTSLAISMALTVVECSIALMVGCVPALRVFWSRVLANTTLQSRLRTMLPFKAINITEKHPNPREPLGDNNRHLSPAHKPAVTLYIPIDSRDQRQASDAIHSVSYSPTFLPLQGNIRE